MDQGAVALMAGRTMPPGSVALQSLTLDMTSGRVQNDMLPGGDVEFPRLHPQRIGSAARFLVTTAGWAVPGRERGPLLHGVQVHDMQTGRVRRFDYGEHAVAEEHIVVPKPGKTGELDAWLLGTTYDARRRATVLNLLDAARVEDGPLAQAVLPYMLPLGFHGNFTAG
jgi:all-trans-8'-apo-beta-carotenal 15,15'-oxygenase